MSPATFLFTGMIKTEVFVIKKLEYDWLWVDLDN